MKTSAKNYVLLGISVIVIAIVIIIISISVNRNRETEFKGTYVNGIQESGNAIYIAIMDNNDYLYYSESGETNISGRYKKTSKNSIKLMDAQGNSFAIIEYNEDTFWLIQSTVPSGIGISKISDVPILPSGVN